MTIPRTERLVARRSLQMRLGPEVADWATEQLVQGYDTPHLRQLAGVSGTEGQGEPRLNFVVQHLLVSKEALIGCFVSMSFSGSVVEVCGD